MESYDRELVQPTRYDERRFPHTHLEAENQADGISHETARSLRCFVGGSGETEPRNISLSLVRDAEQPFDVIIYGGRTDSAWLQDLYARCSNPIAPIVAFDDSLGTRVDAVARSRTPQAVLEAIEAVAPLALRVAALPRLPLGAERKHLIALSLAHTRNLEIVPTWQPSEPDAMGYSLLAGIPQPRRILEDMAETGLLRRRFHERLFVCERCESSRLHAREVCVSCRSSHLTEHPIVHHYPCGTQQPQPAFEQADGYRCPKCRKELRHYGVDYDKPGFVVVCTSCKATMNEPDVSFACADCGHHTPADRACRRDWFSYEPTPAGIEAARTGVLPGSPLLLGGSRTQSVRDFKLVVRQHLALADRLKRPLSAWRMVIDYEELARRAGRPGAEEIRSLSCEVAMSELRDGDASTILAEGLAVCHPETTAAQAADIVRRIERRVGKIVRSPIAARFEMIDRAKLVPFLDELS